VDTFDSGKKTSEFIAEQDRILAEDVVSGAERFWPVHVYLEPTNHCNLRCSMCARSAMDRGMGTMPLDRFKGVVDEIADLGIHPRITLTGQGEPLIDRTLMDKIGHAVSRGGHVSIITNGTLLDERRTEALLNSGIHRVQISFDSLTPETYGRIRIPAVGTGADLFAATKARVERFIRINQSRPEPIFVSISAVISDLNRQEVEAMRTHWIEIGVDNVYFPDVAVRSGLGGYDFPEALQRIRRCSMRFPPKFGPPVKVESASLNR